MKGPAGYVKFVTIVMNILMAVIISTVLMYFMSKGGAVSFSLVTLISLAITPFVVGITACYLIPAPALSAKIAHALHAGRVGSYIIDALVLGIVLGLVVTIVTGFIGFMMQGGIGAVLAFYKQFAVIIIPSAIIVSLIFSYPVGKLATKVSGFDPNAALPADVE